MKSIRFIVAALLLGAFGDLINGAGDGEPELVTSGIGRRRAAAEPSSSSRPTGPVEAEPLGETKRELERRHSSPAILPAGRGGQERIDTTGMTRVTSSASSSSSSSSSSSARRLSKQDGMKAAETIARTGKNVSGNEVNRSGSFAFMDQFNDYMNKGELDAAQGLYDAVSKAKYGASIYPMTQGWKEQLKKVGVNVK